MSKDNRKYASGKSNVENPGFTNTINKYAKEFKIKLTTQPSKVNDDSKQAKLEIIEQVRKKHPKRFALMLPNGELYISGKDASFEIIEILDGENNSILDYTLGEDSYEAHDGRYRFRVKTKENGQEKIREVTYAKESGLSISDPIEETVQPATQPISPVPPVQQAVQLTSENLNSWREVFLQFFNPIEIKSKFRGLRDFIDILNQNIPLDEDQIALYNGRIQLSKLMLKAQAQKTIKDKENYETSDPVVHSIITSLLQEEDMKNRCILTNIS